MQILKERQEPEFIWSGKFIIMFVSPTPQKNIGPNQRYRAVDFVRLLLIVTKKIHKKAVVRNKFRRRIKEAFRMVDTGLLNNRYDYQIIARQSIFNASVNSIAKDIERCLSGNAIPGVPEKLKDVKKKKNKHNRVKTSTALNAKLR